MACIGTVRLRGHQGDITAAGEWVRYSTPHPDGAEYVAICLPAFSPRRFTETRDHGDDMSIRLVVTITAAPGKGVLERWVDPYPVSKAR